MLKLKIKSRVLLGAIVVLASACGGPKGGGDSSSSLSSSDSSSSANQVVDGCRAGQFEAQESYTSNWTSDEVTVFNDNGAWTWISDERAIVDADTGKLIVGSAAADGSSSIDVVIHDLASGQNHKHSLGSLSYASDQNSPGIVITAPGEYVVAYAHHNTECKTYWSRYADGSWRDTEVFDWETEVLGCPWSEWGGKVTYNNPWSLSSEGRIYNFSRTVETSPNFLLSEDDGQTWAYGGRLTASPEEGFNSGYYKYWGNGIDRIDFFATRSHPRDSNTSVYHGYIRGGKSYDSFGNVIDNNLFDDDAPQITQFTQVFKAGDSLDGVPLNRLWIWDLARYENGSIAVIWQARENQCGKCYTPGHHLAYSRFDGELWTSTRLAQGGRTLFRDTSDWWEEDYLGGGALDPDDPNVVYVSSNIDPRDDATEYEFNEIWKGMTCDNGASFSWTPMTMNSYYDNLRPTVPAWDTQNTALLWFRGDYQRAWYYYAEVVGIVLRE